MRLQELATIYQSALLSHCHTVSFSFGSSEDPSSCDSSLLQQKVQTQSATQSMGQTTSCKGFTSRSLERNLNPNLTNQIKFYMLEMCQFPIQHLKKKTRPINPSQDDQGDEGFGREPESLWRAVVFVFDIFCLPSWVGAWKREIFLLSFCWSLVGKR